MRAPVSVTPDNLSRERTSIQPCETCRGSPMGWWAPREPHRAISLAWRRSSSRAKPAVADALAPHLLAGHFHDEGLEIPAREIAADILQAACQVFSHVILSALTPIRIEIEGVPDSSSTSSNQPFRN
jgi:hypothetical protein